MFPSARPLLLSLVVATALPLGCSSSSPPGFVTTARAAPSLTVYQGTPREGFAPPGTPPPAAGSTFAIADQSFFRTPQTLQGDQARALASALADDANYDRHQAGKKCGGFHADWAVEWQRGNETVRALLCFGCGEVRWLSRDGEHINDLTSAGEQKLQALLKPPG
ncbi:MAG TPA: hypothetical protein VFS00_34125 [Polyangiaceae bacterium]|nr:hypothetical protein [Polyangiaceae bacterium]